MSTHLKSVQNSSIKFRFSSTHLNAIPFNAMQRTTGKPKRGQAIAADRLERDWLYIYTIKYTNMVFY